MAVVQTPDKYFFYHTAMPGVWREENLSGEFQFSYEFASFMTAWSHGDVGNSPFQAKWFNIARRKGSFTEPLIDLMGLFTDSGKRCAIDARNIINTLKVFYADIDSEAPKLGYPETFKTLEEIILFGSLSTASIRHMSTLYAMNKDTEYAQFNQKLPTDLGLPEYTFRGKKYLHTGGLHRYPNIRKYIEQLIRHGLVDNINLPRFDHQKGRGRPPVGICLSEMGTRFYELYLAKFDPMIGDGAPLSNPFKNMDV